MFLSSSIYLIVISLHFGRTSACPPCCSTEGKAVPKYQAAVYNLCATLEFTYKNKKSPNPEKKNLTKISLSGCSVFIKPKWQEEQQFLLHGECWEQLGADLGGDFSGRDLGRGFSSKSGTILRSCGDAPSRILSLHTSHGVPLAGNNFLSLVQER